MWQSSRDGWTVDCFFAWLLMISTGLNSLLIIFSNLFWISNFLWLKGLKEGWCDVIKLRASICLLRFFIPKLNSWESHELCQNKVYKADRWYSTIWQASKAIDKRSWSPISGLLWNMGFSRNGRRFVPVECPPKLLLLQVGELNTVYST